MSVLFSCIAFLFSTSLTQAQTLLASLDYGSFQGLYNTQYNINYWRKIPFGAPPTGENRFRAPQPPLPITNGIYNSSQTFDYCPQRTVNGTEDCLYLGLYSRPWTSLAPLRPVVVVFFGGAFIEGGGSFSIPPAGYPILNVSSSNDIVFVYPNYRVNAFGFLPGSAIASSQTSDLNPGLLDQQAALLWTQKYISAFGGDPEQVSIWGQSAGAGSVTAQVIATGNRGRGLFQRALTSSPFWPKTYKYDAPEAEAIYQRVVQLTGCDGTVDELACLKTVDVQKIRDAATILDVSHTYSTSSYTWAPVIEGAGGFLAESLSQTTINGQAEILNGWGMYNTHEGENFIPPGLQNATNSGTPPFNSSTASFNNWLRGFLPGFSDRNIARVLELYPPIGRTEELTYNTTYTQAGLIYRDVVLACPTYWVARAAKKKSYVGEYSISPAKHASDTEWWNQVKAIQKTQLLIYEGFTGAFASFFVTGDPNSHKLTNASEPGVPENWITGEEFVIEAQKFDDVKTDQLNKRCGFWREVADDIPI